MGSLAVIVAQIFQNKNLLPDGSIKFDIAILILILFLLIIIYYFIPNIIFLKLNQILIDRKKNKIARKYLSELEHLKDKFDKLIKTNNGLIGAFERLKNESEIFHILNVPQFTEIDRLLGNFDQSLRDFDKTGKDFELLISQFEVIVVIYNKFYVKRVLEDIRLIKQNKPEPNFERFKDEYETRRAEYDKFVDKYIDFGEKVNKEYGYKIVHEFFVEKLEKL